MRISDCSSDVCSSDLLEGGVSFGDCVAGWVPERDRHLISAGAKSNLSKALRNAAQMETGMKKSKSSILAAMAYPRSEERRGGKECDRTCQSRGAPCH